MKRLGPFPDAQDPRDPWARWGSLRLVVLAAGLSVANILGQSALYVATRNVFAGIAGGALAVVILINALCAAHGLTAAQVFHLDHPRPRAALLSVAAAAAALLPLGLLATLSHRIHPPSDEWVAFYNAQLPDGRLEMALAYGAAVVLGPVAEELVFRGLLFRLCRRHWGLWPSAVLTALLFGIVHGEPWFLFGLIPLGILLAVIYESTGSLTAAAIAHAVHNLVNVTLMVTGDGLTAETPDAPVNVGWLLASLVVLAASMTMLLRDRARR